MSTSISPAAPETVAEAKPKRKVNRKPLYEIAEGVKLEATPEDFNPETHRLTKAMFKDHPCFMEHQAYMHEVKAKDLRAKAEEYRINPPKPGAKKAKLVARLQKLEAKLAELGVNVEDLFADEASE